MGQHSKLFDLDGRSSVCSCGSAQTAAAACIGCKRRHWRHELAFMAFWHLTITCTGGLPPCIFISLGQLLGGLTGPVGMAVTTAAQKMATAKNNNMARARCLMYVRDALATSGAWLGYRCLIRATLEPPGWPGQWLSWQPGIAWQAPPAGQPWPRSHFPAGLQQLQSFMPATPFALSPPQT